MTGLVGGAAGFRAKHVFLAQTDLIGSRSCKSGDDLGVTGTQEALKKHLTSCWVLGCFVTMAILLSP